MPLTHTTLGEVLCHIYSFDFGATIYFQPAERYAASSPCIVASAISNMAGEELTLHQACLNAGFTNWLNVAVVSDTCDSVSEQSHGSLIAAFNSDCQEGGWLRKMMNYRNMK